MATFILFRYQFSPFNRQVHLFDDPDKMLPPERRMERKQSLFYNVLKKDDLQFKYNNKLLKHLIVFDKGDFIVMKIANNRNMTIEKDFVKHKEELNPSALVIIDNRKDVQTIAIEKNSAFNSVEQICVAMRNSINYFLHEEGLEISIAKEYEGSEFWSLVNEYKNKITTVEFHFKYPNLPSVRDALREQLKSSSTNLNSSDTTVRYQAPESEFLILNKDNEELDSLAEFSAETGSEIKMRVSGERRTIKTGESQRSFVCDNLQTEMTEHQDNPNIIIDFLAGIFNKFFR